MVAIPEKSQPTVDAIFAAYEAADPGYQSEKIGASSIGAECARALWYGLRQVTRKKFDGRMLRLFETGNLEEKRFVANLRAAGVEVLDVDPATGKQWRYLDPTGHIVCKLDAAMVGLLEAPKTWHVGEFKTHSAKNFEEVCKKGLKEAKPEHWWQCQIGMHLTGMKRAFYLMRNKDTDHLKSFRIEYDKPACDLMFERAQRIVGMKAPPERISNDPSWFGCKFCDHYAICHQGAPVPRQCRTCMHVTPIDGGTWQCDLFNLQLEREQQRAGCGAHAFIPALVPGEQIDAGQHEGGVWVRYRLADGTEWVDGVPPPKGAAQLAPCNCRQPGLGGDCDGSCQCPPYDQPPERAHTLETHTNCQRLNCHICDGGLANCTTCHGAEASLPKECPGRAMSQEEQAAVQSGALNFVGGEWVATEPRTTSPGSAQAAPDFKCVGCGNPWPRHLDCCPHCGNEIPF